MSAPYTFTTEDVKLLHQWLQQGVSGIEMANRLGRSENTVKCVVRRLRNGGLEHELAKAAFQDQVNAERSKWEHSALISSPVILPTVGKRDGAPEPDYKGNYVAAKLPESVLVIPDLQFPFAHPDAIPFLSMVAQTYQVDEVVGIGDEVDSYCLSTFDKDPEVLGATRELEAAIGECERLFKLFPNVKALHSNHGRGRLEKARVRGGMTRRMVVDYPTLIGAPKGWGFYDEVHMSDVVFSHGDGERKLSKSFLTVDAPREYGSHKCFVHGHRHEQHGLVSEMVLVGDEEYWCAHTGSLINPRAAAFSYTKARKARIGCLVVNRRVPHRIPMRRDAIGRWTGRLAEW